MIDSQLKPMRKRLAFGIVIVFAVAIIMITIPFNGFILPSTAVGQQQQQQQNSNILSSQSSNPSPSPNPLSLRTIFKQVENSVVQITSKTTDVSNTSNPQSPNTTTLGSGFVYDKQGHIVTNGHVVGGAKIVDVTFVNGNRYTARVIASDIYSDIAVLQLLSQNASQPQQQQQQQPLSSFKPIVLG